MPLLFLLLIMLVSAPCFGQPIVPPLEEQAGSLKNEITLPKSPPDTAAGSFTESPDQIWEVGDRRWTVEEEGRFAKWIEENITEDFFIRYMIPTDCADAVYGIRWIYARINHLPAAATTRGGRLIGHWSTDWKDLPTSPEWYEDERFRAALLYLFSETWTGTLSLDTYPILISANSVTPGALFFVTESHAGIIGHVSFDGSQSHPLQTWESSLPVKVKKLSLRNFLCFGPDSKTRSGLVRFRWPILENEEWEYLPDKDHPFYSEEQYASGFSRGYPDFGEAVGKRIDPKEYDPTEKMMKVMETITRFLRERIPIVQTGYEQCSKGGCREATLQWEMYNTAGRDEMIMLLMDHLSQIIESNHFNKKIVKEMMEAIPFKIAKSRSITFYDIYRSYSWLSPHPGDSIEARWGLKKCEMILSQTRSTKNSIAFIEKTYRKKDPRYADFSIRQQQQVLWRLSAEWSKSECKQKTPPSGKKTKK